MICFLRQGSRLVRYSLGTSVNTPFSRVHTLEFELGACARIQGFDLVLSHERGHWVPVWTPILLVLGQSTVLYWLLSSCFRVALDRAKWSNYVDYTVTLLGYSRSVWTQHRLMTVPRNWLLGTKCGQPQKSRWLQRAPRLLKPIKTSNLFNKKSSPKEKKEVGQPF